MRIGAYFAALSVTACVALVHCNAYDRARYGELVDGSQDGTADGATDSARDGDTGASDSADAVDTFDVLDAPIDTGTDAGAEIANDVVVNTDVTPDTGPEACVPSTEVCNGSDDNCDGMIDEGFDLQNDPANCGTCGHACLLAHSAPMCTAGVCVPTCVAGWADCDGNVANGCEADLTLPAHCGRCGHTCSGAAITCDARGACSDEYAAEIAVAGGVSCARRINGTVWCWGNNVEGTIGDGTLFNRPSPVQVFGLTNVTAITASDHHVCALRNDRTVWCWGSNESGSLGDGSGMIRAVPSQVAGLTDAVDVQAGRHHVCAQRMSGAITCWGRNTEAELADGTMTSRPTPVATMGTTGISLLASYGYTNCGIASGSVRCWGRGSSGEIGDGTMLLAQGTPTAVSGIMDAAQVEAGYTSGCARRTNGHVICWGSNVSGQMGDGTRGATLRLAPTAEVTGIADAVTIAVGYSHACAIRGSARTLSCWGSNGSGELGDGTLTVRSTPVAVMGGLSNVVQVSGGDDHTCALLADGTVDCWGSNMLGQLGDGTMVDHLTPAPVVGIP